MATKTATRKPSVDQRRSRYTNDYRAAAHDSANATQARDQAIYGYYGTLPEAAEVDGKTKPISERQRAADTLKALAVKVDDKGRTLDAFEMTPVRVVQIVKTYRRAATLLGASAPLDTPEAMPVALTTEDVAPLITALTTAAKSDALGTKGVDALVSQAASAEQGPEAAEAVVREAIGKAKAVKADKPKAESSPVTPVQRVSAALDSLESILSEVGADLDPAQRSMLLGRMTEISKHFQ